METCAREIECARHKRQVTVVFRHLSYSRSRVALEIRGGQGVLHGAFSFGQWASPLFLWHVYDYTTINRNHSPYRPLLWRSTSATATAESILYKKLSLYAVTTWTSERRRLDTSGHGGRHPWLFLVDARAVMTTIWIHRRSTSERGAWTLRTDMNRGVGTGLEGNFGSASSMTPRDASFVHTETDMLAVATGFRSLTDIH